MMIPKVNPAQMAIMDVVLPQVKNFAEQILGDRDVVAVNPSEKAPEETTIEDVLKEMIRITTFEMVKSEIFYPEMDEDEEVNW